MNYLLTVTQLRILNAMQGSDFPYPLHHASAPVAASIVHILQRVRRLGDPAPLGARSQRQHNEERHEPICASSPLPLGHLIPARLTHASDGLNQARVIVLDVADPRADGPGDHLLSRVGRIIQ
jgi:hypothetical protein